MESYKRDAVEFNVIVAADVKDEGMEWMEGRMGYMEVNVIVVKVADDATTKLM
jgi:hypothetical protein